uniref:MPBQ/MBSQ family SAM-binding methyltransferase profile domain-containing protein n=1 Tax=Aegilops tauschii TaxID=37682 RepID=M8C9C0_AEGTA
MLAATPLRFHNSRGTFSSERLTTWRLKVVGVGGGTGFTTLGIVRHVDPANVTLLDQSPHQLDKARQKEALKGVQIMEGDAEDLPFPTDTFDRYVSAGRELIPVQLALHDLHIYI